MSAVRGGTPYYHWTALADRWGKCVDFGSPITAWTDTMLQVHREMIAPVPVGERTAELYVRARERVRELDGQRGGRQ